MAQGGFPEEDELVLCSVTGINPHSIFAVLDEYNKRTGLIHISEVAPGRIRNIRDYVKEGKKIVCKVLRVDKERGHIDLSLRRVNERERRNKLNEIKQEQFANKIVEQVAKKLKLEVEKVKKDISDKLLPEFGGLYPAFEAVSLEGESLENFGVDKKIAKELTEIVQVRITPPEVKITGDFQLSTYAPDGIERIKNALKEGEKVDGDIVIAYTGAGNYHLTITAEEFKTAEKQLKEVKEKVITYMEKNDGTAEFVRHEGD